MYGDEEEELDRNIGHIRDNLFALNYQKLEDKEIAEIKNKIINKKRLAFTDDDGLTIIIEYGLTK